MACMGRHGGGAFSGKDPSKVDRSACYYGRFIAKNVVASGVAKRCEVQIAYAIGVAQPVGVHVNTFGTGKVLGQRTLRGADLKNFDMRPKALIEELGLLAPIYKKTAAYGHFGRSEFSWEKDLVGAGAGSPTTSSARPRRPPRPPGRAARSPPRPASPPSAASPPKPDRLARPRYEDRDRELGRGDCAGDAEAAGLRGVDTRRGSPASPPTASAPRPPSLSSSRVSRVPAPNLRALCALCASAANLLALVFVPRRVAVSATRGGSGGTTAGVIDWAKSFVISAARTRGCYAGVAAGDELAVDDDFFVDPACTGVPQVGPERRPRGHPLLPWTSGPRR